MVHCTVSFIEQCPLVVKHPPCLLLASVPPITDGLPLRRASTLPPPSAIISELQRRLNPSKGHSVHYPPARAPAPAPAPAAESEGDDEGLSEEEKWRK